MLRKDCYIMTYCKKKTVRAHIDVVVVVLGFYVPPTAEVIRRRDLGLKSHPKDWRIDVTLF